MYSEHWAAEYLIDIWLGSETSYNGGLLIGLYSDINHHGKRYDKFLGHRSYNHVVILKDVFARTVRYTNQNLSNTRRRPVEN